MKLYSLYSDHKDRIHLKGKTSLFLNIYLFMAESCLNVIVHKFACLAFPLNIDISFQPVFTLINEFTFVLRVNLYCNSLI